MKHREHELITMTIIHIIITGITHHIIMDINIITQDITEIITVQKNTKKETLIIPVVQNLQKIPAVHQKKEAQVMLDNQRITPELIDQLTKMSEQLAVPQTVVDEYATYDEFVDWCEIDVGLPLERRYQIFTEAEEKFRKAGFPDHADIIKITHDKIKAENH